METPNVISIKNYYTKNNLNDFFLLIFLRCLLVDECVEGSKESTIILIILRSYA